MIRYEIRTKDRFIAGKADTLEDAQEYVQGLRDNSDHG